MPVKGTYLALAGGGAILLWSGLKGKSWSAVARNVIAGRNPANAPSANPIQSASSPALASGNTTPVAGTQPGSTANEVGTGSNRQILQATAAEFGWTGTQWNCLVNVENAEAGFSTTARNPKSDAFGMAQALGHGVPGGQGADGTNEYGGFGLSTAQAKAANNGDPRAQSLWMCNYIKSTYGNPCAAWAHEQANHWY